MNERRNEGVLQLDVHGMVPVIPKAFAPLQKGAVIWPNRLRQAAAVCNALTYLDRGITVGDAAEKTLFKAVGAQFLVIPLPRSAHNSSCLRFDCCFAAYLLLCFCAPTLCFSES